MSDIASESLTTLNGVADDIASDRKMCRERRFQRLATTTTTTTTEEVRTKRLTREKNVEVRAWVSLTPAPIDFQTDRRVRPSNHTESMT